MADVLHSTLTGTDAHEPKGVATADVGHVYTADGAGSGAWLEPGGRTYGEMSITNNTTAIPLTIASDTTLNTDSDYVQLDNGLWADAGTSNITFNALGYLEILEGGLYQLAYWASMQVSVINTLIGVKFSVDNTNTTLSPRKLTRLSGGVGDTGSLAAFSLVPLTAGMKVSIWAAASKSCNLTSVDSGITLTRLTD